MKNNYNNASPYDESFPIMLLTNAFNLELNNANEVLDDIYESVNESNIDLNYINNYEDKEKMRLIVDARDEILEDIENGKIKLVEENGKLFAQLREKGKYSKKLPIKKDYYKEGITSEQISIALQLKTIQDSLFIISNQIRSIDRSVKEILEGQQNDRISIYYSGVSLYIESLNVNDNKLKNNLISQSMKCLTEAIFKLILIMQSDIRYLKNKEYDLQKKMRAKLITEKINNINQCFSIIHLAFIMKAGIYCEQKEIAATCSVLKEYSEFINGTITPNAPLLSQCDINDNGTKLGIWKKRANLELDVSSMSKLLQNKSNIIVESTEGENKSEKI